MKCAYTSVIGFTLAYLVPLAISLFSYSARGCSCQIKNIKTINKKLTTAKIICLDLLIQNDITT